MFSPLRLCLIIIVFALETSVLCFGIEQLLYVFYQSPTVYSKHDFDHTDDVRLHPKFNVSLPSLLYVPGYLDSPYSASSQLVIEAYFKMGGANVFALDWSTLANGAYPIAAGTKLGISYLLLFMQGLPPDRVIVVGHDLGAQLLGQTGRTIIGNSNGMYKLDRIIGLDPAVTLYYPPSSMAGFQHINRNDAAYVGIIHTDGGGYGTAKLTGTADFYVNTGRRFQSGCPIGVFLIRSDNDLCSHRRAIELWAESVSTPTSTFTATMIGNPAVTMAMGSISPLNVAPGKYKLLTNAASPYSRS